MEKKDNWQEYKTLIQQHDIKKLYHFTDMDNLPSIIQNGGLYSWKDCEEKGITIAKPGGGDVSHSLDKRDGLQRYVRVSFVAEHPMKYVAKNERRISNPVVLEIDPEVIYWKDSRYADRNAIKKGARVGSGIDDFKAIHFSAIKVNRHFDLAEEEREFFQAEILVKNFIPLEYIKNIGDFGIHVPTALQKLQSKTVDTAQIARNTPTAFIFLVDQSVSMQKKTNLLGEEMSMAEAAAHIVNRQINELVLRCIKFDDICHYYDIAVIGYGNKAYSGWNGDLEGRGFVSPKELRDHPYKKIITREKQRTRRGIKTKEVEKVQWIKAQHDGHLTHLHDAFSLTKELLDEWMKTHHDKDYSLTIINITDERYNGVLKNSVHRQVEKIKSMYTNEGCIILFNINILQNKSSEEIVCPIDIKELKKNRYAETLFNMSKSIAKRI